MLTGVAIAAAIGLVTVPLWGSLSDRFGRKKLYMAGAVFSTLFAFPFFMLVDTKETVLVWLAIVLGVNVGHDLMYGPQAAYYSELFGTRVRYSRRLARLPARVGPVRRLRAADRRRAAGREQRLPTLVAVYMVVMGVITIVATAFARETYRDAIEEARAQERRFFREGEGEVSARARHARAGRSLTGPACAIGGVRCAPQRTPSSRSRSRARRRRCARRTRRRSASDMSSPRRASASPKPSTIVSGVRSAWTSVRSCASASAVSCVIVVVAQRDLAALEGERDGVHAVAGLELADRRCGRGCARFRRRR